MPVKYNNLLWDLLHYFVTFWCLSGAVLCAEVIKGSWVVLFTSKLFTHVYASVYTLNQIACIIRTRSDLCFVCCGVGPWRLHAIVIFWLTMRVPNEPPLPRALSVPDWEKSARGVRRMRLWRRPPPLTHSHQRHTLPPTSTTPPHP